MKKTEFEVRLEKLNKMREEGINPYPYSYDVSHTIGEVKKTFDILERKEEIVSIAGRIMARRGHGKAAFFDIMDGSGKIQCYIRTDVVGDDKYKIFKKYIDIGDFVGIKGKCFVTKMGEKSIMVEDIDILSKSLRPLPEKFHGLQDKEKRYRKRYLDLIMNRDVLDVFRKRTQMIKLIRNFLDERGFMEVETPILQPQYGGAFARPFITHYNALDRDFYLRISNELYLKRLIIGGIDRVYEFAKDFRNEGMDKTHNPEFTQIEIYQSYADYNDMMSLVEEMFRYVAENLNDGNPVIKYGEHEIDFSKRWERVSFFEGIEKETGYDLYGKSLDEIKEIAKKLDIDIENKRGYGDILDEIFSTFVQPKLIQPTFVINHPIELTPLAKRHRQKEGLVERFEPIICGMEIGNAYSELNDPVDQRERFEEQQKIREKGGEAEGMDEDFLEAMEYGMPPTGGLGIGIDRMAMIFTDSQSIRDVIIFPHLKPKSSDEG